MPPFTSDKYWKTWFPTFFARAPVPSENVPPFWNPKYAIAWSSAPDPAEKRIVLHMDFVALIWVLSWKGENR